MKRKILAILLAVCMVITALPLSAAAAPSVKIVENGYIDENGDEQTCSNFTVVYAGTEKLGGSGAYKVSSDITLNEMLTIDDGADVKLVLANGATLNVPKGIQTAAGTTGSLSVYTDGSDAKLIVGSEDETESKGEYFGGAGMYIKGNLTLAGGTITIRDKNHTNVKQAYSHGLWVHEGSLTVANCTVTSTGGDITATGNNNSVFADSAGIFLKGSTGTLTIRNATVNAIGGSTFSNDPVSAGEGSSSTGLHIDTGASITLRKNAVLNCTAGDATAEGVGDSYGLASYSRGANVANGVTISGDESTKLTAKSGKAKVTGSVDDESAFIGAVSCGFYNRADCTLDGGTIYAECGTAELNGSEDEAIAYDIYADENILRVKNDPKLDVETGRFDYLRDDNTPPKNNLYNILKVGQAFFNENGDLVTANGYYHAELYIGEHECSFSQSTTYTCDCGRSYAQEPVPYLDENGTKRYCGEYTLVTQEAVDTSNEQGGLLWPNGDVVLSGGWNVVKGNVTTEHQISLNGSGIANIILTDGCHFTTTDRLLGTYYLVATAFYAQSTGDNMGKATFGSATAEDGMTFEHELIINGGDITAIQGAHTDAEGDSNSRYYAVKANSLTVNGGKLTAKSTKTTITDAKIDDDPDATYAVHSYGITVDDEFTVNGGTVTATGGDWEISGDTCGIIAESIGIHVPEDAKLTVNGGSVTGTGGTVTTSTTGDIECTSHSYGIVTYDEDGFELNGGSVTANGGNVTANGADGDSDAYSYGLYCYGANVNGGSFTATHGTTTSTAEDADLNAYEVIQRSSDFPMVVSGGTVKLGASEFSKLIVKNEVKLADLLKEGCAYYNSGDDGFMEFDDLANHNELEACSIVLCPHEEQTGTCAYCNKSLPAPGTGGSTGGGSYTPGSNATVTPAAGGTTEVSNPSPAPGETVSVTPKPNDGMRVETITVTDQNGNTIEIKRSADGSFTFTQPDGDVTITVTYGEQPTFGDVSAGAWYADAVEFAVKNGLFSGMGNNKFEPNAPMTRAMFATVLWNFAGKPTGFTASYGDVHEGDWFYAAIAWASEQGIVSGTGGGKFDPNAEITREEMVTMLWNYSGKMQARSTLSAFGDHQSVSSWAQAAMQWAVSSGVISGKENNTLDPDGTAVRAEAATIFMNYLKK